MTWLELLIILVKIVVILLFALGMVPILVWVERKLVGHFQQRIGPHRVGPDGILQGIADGLKLFLKEDIIPRQADKLLYVLAPVLSLTPALMIFAVIPFGPKVTIGGRQIELYLADLNVAVLYVLALGSVGVYGVVLAGWSSNNKYSLLGACRSAAQMVSYELPLSVALITPLMIVGSLSLVDIVQWQEQRVWLVLPGLLAFVVFMVCGIAEANRGPFDLPEAEQELIAGYLTEYSSFKFAMFFMAEYAHVISVSAIATTVFLGGWDGPFLPPVVWFLIKLSILIFLFMWLRATLPRLRYDWLMKLGWLRLLPLALVSLFLTAVGMAVFGGWFRA